MKIGEIKNMEHQMSSIVFRLLNDLKKQYEIKYYSGNHNERERVMETKSKTNTIDVIYEKFIRLCILDPNLKTNIRFYYSQNNDSIYKIQLPTIKNNLDKRNSNVVERDNNLVDKMSKLLLDSHSCIYVNGEVGTGKKELANELGWRVHADYCVRVFNFDKIESDFRQFAAKLGAHATGNAIKDLAENVACRLEELDDRKFLFIILDVLDLNDLELYMTHQILSLTNVKILLTTPHEHLHFEQSVSIRLDLFSIDEVNKYLSAFYTRKPKLNDIQKKKIFKLGGMKGNG